MNEEQFYSNYKKQQTIDRLKEWPVKILLIGIVKLDEEIYHVDSVVVCNDEQALSNKKRFLFYREFELKEKS